MAIRGISGDLIMVEKEKRLEFIRASDKRVAHWPKTRQKAFYMAVQRITGKPVDIELEKKEMKINPIVNDYHFLIHPEMNEDEKYWCASTAEWKLSVTGYGDSPAKALKDLKKHLTNVIECMNKNNEPVILPHKPTNDLKIVNFNIDSEFIDYNRRPTQSEIDDAMKGMENAGIITNNRWKKLTQDVSSWPNNGDFCWVKVREMDKTFHKPVEFYCGKFIHHISASGTPKYYPWDDVYWAPATPLEFDGER